MSMMNSAHGPHHSRCFIRCSMMRDATENHLGNAPMLLQSKLEQLLAAFGQFTSRLETAMALAAIYREAAASPMCLSLAGFGRLVRRFCCRQRQWPSMILRSQFWTDDARVVLISATLSAAGQFDLLKRDLGLPGDAVSKCYRPFRLCEQCTASNSFNAEFSDRTWRTHRGDCWVDSRVAQPVERGAGPFDVLATAGSRGRRFASSASRPLLDSRS